MSEQVQNADSILNTIKIMLGSISVSDDSFDNELIFHINSVISILHQLGIVEDDTFKITGESEEWADMIPDMAALQTVKDYVFCRVKVMFDPPQTSYILDSYKSLITELEFRMMVAKEDKNYDQQ